MASPGITLHSKLPDVGTTIFAVMSARAQAVGAVNLGQGFPDFAPDALLVSLVAEAMAKGHNQYAPMPGLITLREAMAAQAVTHYGKQYDPETEVTITSGATEALFDAIAAVVHPGDEVIVLEPSYDCYVPAIRMAGGTPVIVKLRLPDYSIDWPTLQAAVTPRTRALLINTPHNPTGAILTSADMEALAALTYGTDILIISDEVYEHIIYDDALHQSVARYPALAERSFVIGSFGKSLHVTGWKLGYCLAPKALTTEFRKVHQFVTFASNHPMQWAIAQYLNQKPDFASALRSFYQKQRDYFSQLMLGTRFTPLPSRGTYFQLYAYDKIVDKPDTDFALWLNDTHKVASIPISAFYSDGTDAHIVRFCFAKRNSTLEAAAAQLQKV